MKTYKQVFAEIKKPALIPFFVIGDPDFDTSLEIVKGAIDGGADVLELGIAFSDPIADGPTIQKADIRALNAGITVERAKEFIAKVKEYKDIPIGLLMYYNLIFQYGTEKFFSDFAQAGTNSVLIADLSIDDVDEIYEPARKAGLDTVFMVTPNTETERAKRIAEKCTGFIYTVSLLGVTGGRDTLSDMIKPLISRLKSLTNVPVCVGFGVSKAEHAIELAKAGADGVIIGSRVVKIIEENLNDTKSIAPKVKTFVSEIKEALSKI
ncbi:MAG: tryptophan synthase subunit alpha [Planctomycetes bacterium GWF2_42_9]|nr:MAG: tryptophan synthase subunit alpha [Planctomycetes bacterium GWF2_42_9]HAL45533.1 tryptophan synthase subunit alpha [Phycisphaerales bacterium]